LGEEDWTRLSELLLSHVNDQIISFSLPLFSLSLSAGESSKGQ
jgi:hypothetical protein